MLGHITATPKRKNFDVNIGNSSFLDSIHFTNQTVSGEVYIPDIFVFHPPSTKKQIIPAFQHLIYGWIVLETCKCEKLQV